jgi:hypothetical protein
VGALYDRLRRDLGRQGPLAHLQASAEALARQADPTEEWAHAGLGRQPVIRRVRSAAEAITAIDAISSQGEGFPRGEESHFARFRHLYRGMRFVALLPEAWAFRASPEPGNSRELRPIVRALGGFSSRVAELVPDAPTETPTARLFNARYQILLLLIHEALDRARETPGRKALVSLILSETARTLRPLAVRVREEAPSGRLPPVYVLPRQFPAEATRRRRDDLRLLIDSSARVGAEVARHGGDMTNVVQAMREADTVCVRVLGAAR